jgi:hypothetical protein
MATTKNIFMTVIMTPKPGCAEEVCISAASTPVYNLSNAISFPTSSSRSLKKALGITKTSFPAV